MNFHRSAIAFVVMIIAVVAVYWLPGFPEGARLRGVDYLTLHQRRISFARDAIIKDHILPQWYPREQLGTPFFANLQDFPWIPNRLALLWLDPSDFYTVAIFLSAILSAGFTFLYARRIGFSPLGAAAAGWTFVCCGYFASRVRAGHLTMLEAYVALPLLLWLIERAIDKPRIHLFWLGFVSAGISLAGHPQIPLYALAAAAIYALVRCFNRLGIAMIGAMFAGGLIAAFALVPMTMLIARSSRVLPLDVASSHITLPYHRLLAFFLPWFDGAPPHINHPLSGGELSLPNLAYFWDSVCYAGWMPWIGCAFLVVTAGRDGQPLTRRTKFLIILGVAGVVLALPFWRVVLDAIPGTLLRSPARLLYFTSFALALALGAACDAVLRNKPRLLWLVLIALLVHGFDVGWHARAFVMEAPAPPAFGVADDRRIRDILKDGRIAMDWELTATLNRTVDDIGFYDSLTLAPTYRRLIRLASQPSGTNVEDMDGSRLTVSGLQECGVRVVLTRWERDDLPKFELDAPINAYEVPNARPRASWVVGSGQLKYARINSDVMEVVARANEAGIIQVLEAFDAGWRATLNSVPVPIEPSDSAFMQVTVPSGDATIRFEYHTPGLTGGIVVSAVGVLLLGVIVLRH